MMSDLEAFSEDLEIFTYKGQELAEIPTEAFFADLNPLNRASEWRTQILGCIGTAWLRTAETQDVPSVFGYDIMQCTGARSLPVYSLLRKLVRHDLVVRTIDVDDRGPGSRLPIPRTLYNPSNTALGSEFYELVTAAAADCPPERHRLP